MVKLLLEKEGVDMDSKNERGQTPLWYAAERWHLEKEGVDVNSKHSRYAQALLSWAVENRWEMVKLLIEKEGVDVDSKGKYDGTPLS